jgi:hypothetical protein
MYVYDAGLIYLIPGLYNTVSRNNHQGPSLIYLSPGQYEAATGSNH